MRKADLTYLQVVLGVVIILVSCSTSKKISTTKNKLTTVDNQLQQQSKALKDLDEQRKKKESLNEIDDTASARIQRFIHKSDTEIDSQLSQNTVRIGEALVSKNDWNRLVGALIRSQKLSKAINNKVVFLKDLVNQNTVINLDQDLIFEPGKYTVTPEVEAVIGKFFEPAAREIDLFIKKYPDFPLSLVITAKGYADGTSIAEGTSLYKDLVARLKLNVNPPDNKELNKELSRARAQEVIALFKKFSTDRSGNGATVKNILYFYEGKGETCPDPKVNDYKTDDPRRRVVLLFWSLFPDN